jgi:large subunit ribosomal protein L24e
MPFDSFSKEPIPPGRGIMFVKKDGTIFYFKNSKTFKNMLKLGREGRLIKWTNKSIAIEQKTKQKEAKESALAKEIEEKLKEKQQKKQQESKDKK